MFFAESFTYSTQQNYTDSDEFNLHLGRALSLFQGTKYWSDIWRLVVAVGGRVQANLRQTLLYVAIQFWFQQYYMSPANIVFMRGASVVQFRGKYSGTLPSNKIR